MDDFLTLIFIIRQRSARVSGCRSRSRSRCYHPPVPRRPTLAAIACAASLAIAAPAIAQDDFAPSGGSWNSVSELIQFARDRGVPVEIPDRLDVGTLRPTDSLLILHPNEPIPSREITAFLRAGGRVLLADDFGAGDSLLD